MVNYITIPPCQACEDLAEVPGTAEYNSTVFGDIPAALLHQRKAMLCGKEPACIWVGLRKLHQTIKFALARPMHQLQHVRLPAAYHEAVWRTS